MMIHNGDHAQFEIDNAHVPPEQRPDWPLPSFDARDWATAFVRQWPSVQHDAAVAWFANALMRGFDENPERIVREFIGFLSADIPELHKVEVPRLAESWERFKRTGKGKPEGTK